MSPTAATPTNHNNNNMSESDFSFDTTSAHHTTANVTAPQRTPAPPVATAAVSTQHVDPPRTPSPSGTLRAEPVNRSSSPARTELGSPPPTEKFSMGASSPVIAAGDRVDTPVNEIVCGQIMIDKAPALSQHLRSIRGHNVSLFLP